MELLCLEFMNTYCCLAYKPYLDPLRDRDWFLRFLKRWSLPAIPPLTESEISQLVALRASLLAIVDGLTFNKTLSQDQLDWVNRNLMKTPLYHRLQQADNGYISIYEPLEEGWDYVVYKIIASFAEFISGYSRDRIKRCENSQCKEVFYDESKNNSKRFCGNKCLSLIKVRRFRERQKEDNESK